MRKTISLIILAFAIIAGGLSMDAKTTKKKSSSKTAKSSVAITDTFFDGYPYIVGHSYSKVEEGVKMVFKFEVDELELTLSQGKLTETLPLDWGYEGDGYLWIEPLDGNGNLVLYIGDNGQKLYMVDSYGNIMYNYGPLKIVK